MKSSPIVILLCVLFGVVGCTTFEDISYRGIKNKMALLDLSNGVNDQEAIVLAQHFIISKGLGGRLYTLKPVSAEKKNVWESPEGRVEFYIPPGDDFQGEVQQYWMVLFRDKKGSQFFGHYPVIPFYVKVDAASGEIIRWGLKTDDVK